MSVHKKIQEQLNLDDEYGRIAENEAIYYDEISFWKKLGKCTMFLVVVAYALMVIPYFLLPQNIRNRPILELFSEYPLAGSLIIVSLILIPTSIITLLLLSYKTSKIRDELGLHRDERIYLRAYETSTTIDSYLKEPTPERKLYFKRLALQYAEELTENVQGWKYGNIRLVASLIGDKIDLLKDNMRRLVLSNVAKGDDEALKRVSKTLIELCKFIHSPSIEKIDELNGMIEEIPFKEYKYLTKKERASRYFYKRPRIFRLIFASGITIPVVAVLLCLEQNVGLIIAVGVTCFWGSFSGFDKIFRLKEK